MSGFCQRCFASLSIVSLLLGSHAVASETYACRQPVPTDSWVVLAGEALPDSVISRLQQLPGHRGKTINAEVLVATLVDNRLLAAYAEKTLQEEGVSPLSTVGFDPAYRTDMSEAQQRAAQQLNVARFSFPGQAPREYTLWDLYAPQNIQMRLRMHALEGDALVQALNERVAADFVMTWVAAASGLSAAEQDWLQRYVTDAERKQSLLQSMGLAKDLHEDNAVLRARREALSQAEIDVYYRANRHRFQRIEHLRARHIRVENEAQAAKVIVALQSGMAFGQAVKTYSIAEDRHAGRPGELPEFAALKEMSGWLANLAATVEPGTWSRPVRSPAGAGEEAVYEIVQVDSREMGYYSADSETVRYLAGREIASDALIKDYRNLREHLYDQAALCINRSRLSHDATGLKRLAATQTIRGAW